MAQVDSIDIPTLRAEPYKKQKNLSKEEITEILIALDTQPSKRLAGMFDVSVMTINNVKNNYVLLNNVLYRRV